MFNDNNQSKVLKTVILGENASSHEKNKTENVRDGARFDKHCANVDRRRDSGIFTFLSESEVLTQIV